MPYLRRTISHTAILLLLFASLVSVVHAAEHPFHVDEAFCDIAMAAEQQEAADAHGGITAPFISRFTSASQSTVSVFFETPRAFRSRAPPVS